MNMFTRARLNLALTPAERAFLKALKGIATSVVLAGATAVWPLVQAQTINWRTVGEVAVGSMAVTFFYAMDKYWTAQGDPALGAVAGDMGTVIAQKTGVSDVKQPS